MQVTLANHAHVFPEEVRSWGTIEKLLELMEQCQIEKAVAFALSHAGSRRAQQLAV